MNVYRVKLSGYNVEYWNTAYFHETKVSRFLFFQHCISLILYKCLQRVPHFFDIYCKFLVTLVLQIISSRKRCNSCLKFILFVSLKKSCDSATFSAQLSNFGVYRENQNLFSPIFNRNRRFLFFFTL